MNSYVRQISCAAAGSISDAFSMEKVVATYGRIHFFPFRLSNLFYLMEKADIIDSLTL